MFFRRFNAESLLPQKKFAVEARFKNNPVGSVMFVKFVSIHSAFCFLAATILYSIASAAQSQTQELIPARPVGVRPEWNLAPPTVAPAGFDEPVESGLFPESVEAIEWLNRNFGIRVEGNDIDRWLSKDLDESQRRAIATKRFAEARESLIAEVREASSKNENMEMFVGSIFSAEQTPVLICLRDGELFVIPVNDRYCELRNLGPERLSIVSRRERFRTFQPVLTLSSLQVEGGSLSEDGSIILNVEFDVTIDQPLDSDTLELAIDFQQGKSCGTSIRRLGFPEDTSGNELGVRNQVKFQDGDLDLDQPVLVFVTAIRSHGSSDDDILKNSTRISNSVRMVLTVSVDE